MTKVVIYTHIPAAAKITFDLDASQVSMKPTGGADGVPPGMTLLEGTQIVCWVGAQDFGIAVVEDERFKGVESGAPGS